MRSSMKNPGHLRSMRRCTSFGNLKKSCAEALEHRTLLSGYSVVTGLSPNGGQTPVGGVVVDSLGDIFGTSQASLKEGEVWEVTSASLASNQPSTTLVHSFDATGGSGDGSTPQGDLIIDSHDNIFGTTKNGGANRDGAIFEISGNSIAAGSPTVTIIASFDGTNGIAPVSGLLLQGSTLYGTVSSGGAHNSGAVYKVSTTGSAITDLVSFTGLGAQGSTPQTSLVADASGNLYGTTVSGGTSSVGTVFEVNPNTNQLTTLYDFTNGTDGARPMGRLAIDGQGNLFGACEMGGSTSVNGCIYEISGASIRAGAATLQVLHGFDNTDGFEPHAGVILVGTDIYGTTFGDRNVDYGTLFEISGGSFDTLHTFMYATTDGVQPDTDLTYAGGLIYGLTRFGPGELYSYEPSVIHGSNQNQLVFGQEPTNTTAGAAISPAVTVKIEDSGGNVVTSDNSVVTLAVGLGPSTSLGGTISEQAVAGVATFPDLSLAVAGTYTLVATDSNTSLASAASTSFVISPSNNGTPQTPAKLAFVEQPLTSKLNGPISTVQVAIEDATGAVVAGDNSVVTISLAKGTPHATLGGTVSVAAVDGIATFSTLTLNRDGQYGLVAADGTLNKAISNLFSIVPILVWGVEPGLTTAGKKISPALTVHVVDYLGNPVLTDKSSVTLSFAHSPLGSKLAVKPVPIRNGVATFPKVTLTKAGFYGLQASDGLADAVTSNDFSVLPAPAKLIIFDTLPKSVSAGQTFKVVVKLADQYLNLATNNISQIVLSLSTKPKGAILNGTVVQSVIEGYATFDDLSLANPGLYKLTATDLKTTPKPAKSAAFQVG